MDEGAVAMKPRPILRCVEPGCHNAWYQFGRDHGRAIRRARKRGWDGTGNHGCMCADRGQLCPDHSGVEPVDPHA